MNELLDEMELALIGLMQSGLDTGGPGAVPRLRSLARQCEETGLHTGGALLSEAAEALASRPHTLEKNDLALAAVLCRTVRYLELCRERMQEESILRRWQEYTDEHEGGNP